MQTDEPKKKKEEPTRREDTVVEPGYRDEAGYITDKVCTGWQKWQEHEVTLLASSAAGSLALC